MKRIELRYWTYVTLERTMEVFIEDDEDSEEAVDRLLDRREDDPAFFPELPGFGPDWDAHFSDWPEDDWDWDEFQFPTEPLPTEGGAQ
jgi:hypothetical protein